MTGGVESPWRKVADLAVGGLTEIGFGHFSTLLLVVSHQGRGLVDRDRQETGAWFDVLRTASQGIGPLAGQWIDLAGLAGGHLATSTPDGWHARRAEDGIHLSGPSGATAMMPAIEEVRAFGFSYDGMVLVVASSSSLIIS